MLPDYVARHNSQDLGFKGSDLAEKRRGQLRARAPEMDADSIHSLCNARVERNPTWVALGDAPALIETILYSNKVILYT